VKMLANRSKSGKRLPKTSHAAARTSFCMKVWGGTDVAIETRAAVCITKSFVWFRLSWETSTARVYFSVRQNLRLQGPRKLSLKCEAPAKNSRGAAAGQAPAANFSSVVADKAAILSPIQSSMQKYSFRRATASDAGMVRDITRAAVADSEIVHMKKSVEGWSVLERKPAPDLIRGGQRFA
jgi:hypothetical protein